MDIHLKTLTQLASDLENGDFTSVALTEALLDRIASLNDKLNAFVTVTGPEALAAAARADEARKSGKGGLLNGLPIIHKDIFCTRGVKTTCGSKMLENFISPYDATVVEKIAAAGAVVLGKSNMDEFAMGPESVEARVFAGRFVGWLGCVRCGEICTGGNRNGYRRVHSPTGGADRNGRAETNLWPCIALRHDRVRVEPGSGRRYYTLIRGCRPLAWCNGWF